MFKNFILIAIAVTSVIIGYMLLSTDKQVTTSVCSDDVRSYERNAEAALAGTATNFEQVKVSLSGDTSLNFTDRFNNLTPTDFLSIKTADTQCKLLEACFSRSDISSVAEACPVEYEDYKSHVGRTLELLAKLEAMQHESERLIQQTQTVQETNDQLQEAMAGAGVSGGRVAVLRQRLDAERSVLGSQVESAATLADEIHKALSEGV